MGYEWCIYVPFCAEPILEKMNADLFISVRPEIPPVPGVTSMLCVHMPAFVKELKEQSAAYDNFILTIYDMGELGEYLEETGRKYHILRSFCSVPKQPFCDKPKQRIAYIGTNWDQRRRDHFKNLFALLDKTGYCDFYGPKDGWQGRFKSYRRMIPLQTPDDIIDVMKDAGIALVLHSKEHYETGTATLRDFEAASASCVIITERTRFMEENFNDCALFIDCDKSAREILQQISAHVRWIHRNPQKAMEMARKSHEIFCEKLSLDDQVKDILALAEKIKEENV
ncbi:MAG: hypothetical protein LBC42_01185 [Puniceicoccales bacterium]|nr:hypothetical protein [Puniceicoccales bacterium]